MARFLEVNTTIGNAQFPAGNYLINIDKITSLNPNSGTETLISWNNTGTMTNDASYYILIEHSPADNYINQNDSMTAYILDAIKTTSNSKNSVVKLKDFLPNGTEVTQINIET
jgi:hypothetical protein